MIQGIGSGFARQFAPKMLAGMLNNTLNDIPQKQLVEWVEGDVDLWEKFGEEHVGRIIQMAGYVSDVDWITSDWMIEATRKEHPLVASLFLGWPEARTWLDKNLDNARAKIASAI